MRHSSSRSAFWARRTSWRRFALLGAAAVLGVGGCATKASEAGAADDAPPPVNALVSDVARDYVTPAMPQHLEALPPLPDGHTVKVDLVLLDRTIEVAPNVRYRGWTFNGTIPGPVIHARVGDTIDVTLTNKAAMGHSIDFHAALAPPNVAYQTIAPGKTLRFTWVAKMPGAFVYHCGTPPVLAHISNGMYGAIVVDPADEPPPEQSFVLVQSEFYPAPAPGSKTESIGDLSKMETARADVVVFNGRAFQYMTTPLAIKVGKPVRVYVVDAGPSHFSAFHVIGTLFTSALADGNPQNVQHGIQTIAVPPGGGAIGDFTVHQAGHYPFVTHQFGDADHGAMGAFEAT